VVYPILDLLYGFRNWKRNLAQRRKDAKKPMNKGAAPVRDRDGMIVASIGISAPLSHFADG
jgi:DNA-binding IclR family transcriptional regulator